MARTESVVGRITKINITKGILKLEITAAKSNFPDSVSVFDGLWAIVHVADSPDLLEGRPKTPIEEEAEEGKKKKKKQEPTEGMNPPPQKVEVTVTHKMDGPGTPVIDVSPEVPALNQGDVVCAECAAKWDEKSSTIEEAGEGVCSLCGKASEACFYVEAK